MSRKMFSTPYRFAESVTRLCTISKQDLAMIDLRIVMEMLVVDLKHGRGRPWSAAVCPCPSRCGGGEITANVCRRSLVCG